MSALPARTPPTWMLVVVHAIAASVFIIRRDADQLSDFAVGWCLGFLVCMWMLARREHRP